MAFNTGLDAQIGFAEESGYNSLATVTRFHEFNNEKISADVQEVRSHGIGTGRWQKTGRRKTYVKSAGGAVEFDVMSKGFGLLFKHALGAYANVLVAGSERKATINEGSAGGAGLSLTCQVGRPDTSGTVRAFTYGGGKIKSAEFKQGADDRLLFVPDFDFASVVTNVGLATPSYPTAAEIFVFSEAALSLNSATYYSKDFSWKVDNMLATDRRFIGNVKKEPYAAGTSPITGQLSPEFNDLAAYAAWIAGTEVANLVVTYTTPTTIAGGGNVKLIFTFPNIVYTGAQPNVDGPGVLQNPIPWEALYDGTNAIVTIEQRTLDTAA